jgi:hypothetical protein
MHDSYTRQTRQIDHDEQIKPQQDEGVPKSEAVAGGNQCSSGLAILIVGGPQSM